MYIHGNMLYVYSITQPLVMFSLYSTDYEHLLAILEDCIIRDGFRQRDSIQSTVKWLLSVLLYLSNDNFPAVVLKEHGEVPPGPRLVVILGHRQQELEIVDVLDVFLFLTLYQR